MPDHVAVRVIEDDDIILAALNAGYDFIRNKIGAHFRLEVVSGNPGRRNQRAVLTRIGCFHSSVEKEGHMRVFLRFRDAQLGQSQF